ncbi:hypothetical protein D3C84_707880 [compost metagenome]
MTTLKHQAALACGIEQAAFLVAAHAVRVDPHPHIRLGVFREGRVEHADEIRLTQPATGNRKVAVGLIHHQHQRPILPQRIVIAQVWRIVVLADATAAHQRNQLPRGGQICIAQGVRHLQDVFQQRRPIGQVVNANRVDHHRHRRIAFHPQRRRTQEAVLQRHIGNPPTLAQYPRMVGRTFVADPGYRLQPRRPL